MRRTAVALGVVALAIGIGLLAVAGNFLTDDSALAAKGGRAEGQVIRIATHYDHKSKSWYRPVVAFTDTAGQRREFTSKLSSNPPGYEAGDAVGVMYDPADPARAEIDSFASRHLGTLVFGLFGAVFTMLGLVVTVRAVR